MAANQNRPSLQMFEQVFPSLRGAEYSTLKHYLEDGKSVFPLVEKGVPGLVADFGLTPADAQRFLQRANALAIYVRRQFIEQRLYGADTEVAKPSSGLLSIVEGPSFEGLFNVGFDSLCPPDALESVASPVAYLVDLMKWVSDRIESVPDDGVKAKIPLSARRQDLARLPIDFNAVHQAVSAVDIILAKLETFIKDHTDGPDDFDVNEAMSTARYPNGLPYYQAWVTLDYVARQNALSVGDVTRAVDQAYPYFLQPEAWATEGGRAMLHASRLGPYQRLLLTADPIDSDDRERFYWLNFGTYAEGSDWQNISQVPFFCERTKLDALQLEALLSLRSFAPVRSANALPVDGAPSGAQSGSVYLNAGSTPAVSIDYDADEELRRLSVFPQEPARYDRMNRKLRLDQWMGLPPEQVDGLLVAAINAQVRAQIPDHPWWISDHTVQALGLFQELRERYDCTAEDFSVFVDALSIFGRGDMPSQFDRVFNAQTTFQAPLILDGGAFPVFPVASAEELTIKQLCSGLGIDLTTYSYLALTIAQAHGREGTLLRNLAIVSSFYRLVKLPRLLGITPVEGLLLLTTLGGDTWLKALAGVPIIGQNYITPVVKLDVLNIIHAMESCVSWCRERELPVLWMVQQVSPIVASATASANEQQLFEKLRSLLPATLFSDNALLMAGVPPLAGGAAWLDLLTSLVDSNGLVITEPSQTESDYLVFAREQLDTAVREGLGEDEEALRAPVVEKMLAVLLQVRAGQVSVVKESLAVYAGVTSELAIPVLTWAKGTVYSVLNQALERADDSANRRWRDGENEERFLALLADVRRRSAVVLKLDLSVELLEDYLTYGYLDWFAGVDKHAFSLRILYYLTVLTRAFGLSEQSSTQLLDYLREVNALPESLTGDALELVRETAAIRLAAFFNWSVQEVRECASRINSQHLIRNLKELDLMLRVRVLATRTHMDAETLFLMGTLPATLDRAVYRTAAEHAVLSLYESRVPLIPAGDEALKPSTKVTIVEDRDELVAKKAGEKATFTVTVTNASGRALSGIFVNGHTTLGSIDENAATDVHGVAIFELLAGDDMGEAIVHFKLPLRDWEQAPSKVKIGADKTTLFFPSSLKSPVPTNEVLFGESIELSAVMLDSHGNLGIGMPVLWSSTPEMPVLDIRPREGVTDKDGRIQVTVKSPTGGTFVVGVTSVHNNRTALFDSITFSPEPR
jgi:hypothetical protein